MCVALPIAAVFAPGRKVACRLQARSDAAVVRADQPCRNGTVVRPIHGPEQGRKQAVDFFTWRTLRRQGLSNNEAVELMAGMVRPI
jgi:hypothetical protein